MKNYITQEKLKVKCNFPIQQIYSLVMKEKTNHHGTVRMVADIETGSLELAENPLNGQPIKVCTSEQGVENLLFYGVISGIQIIKEVGYDRISLEAYSLSWLMDLERKSRSFQDVQETFAILAERIAEEQSFSLLFSGKDREIQKPLIQYEETNWEFLLRLAAHLGQPVFATANYEERGIYFCFPKETEPQDLEADEERWCMDPNRRKKSRWRTMEDSHYEIVTGEILHLGQPVAYKNRILWPYEITTFLKRGVLVCSCILSEKGYGQIPAAENPGLTGNSLTGTVLERKEERIKIHLDIDEEQEMEKAYFYPWLPEHGNLAYLMPETGSRVCLLIPNGDERNGIGIHCIGESGPTIREGKVPSNRWLVTKEDKKLAVYPSAMELSSAIDESRVSLQDGVGNVVYSRKEIRIQAKGKVTIQGGKVDLMAPKEVAIVKRQLGSPCIVNICHNLDAMGRYSTFQAKKGKRLPAARKRGPGQRGSQTEGRAEKGQIKKKEKLQFQMKELMEQEEKAQYELGASMIYVLAAIPQRIEMDPLAQIAAGFRPIGGRMKGG